MIAVGTAILTALSAFIGAWLAAYFALNRFYREKIWERRAISYTAIFDALHDMGKWFDLQIGAKIHGQTLDEARVAELTAEYQKAGAELQRRVASETWLLSDRFRTKLEELENALSKKWSNADWDDFLAYSHSTIVFAVDELRSIARADLSASS